MSGAKAEIFRVIVEVTDSTPERNVTWRSVSLSGAADVIDATNEACLYCLKRHGAFLAKPLLVIDGLDYAWKVEDAIFEGYDEVTFGARISVDEKILPARDSLTRSDMQIKRIDLRKVAPDAAHFDPLDPMGYGAKARQLVHELMAALQIGPADSIRSGIDRLKNRAEVAEAEVKRLHEEKEQAIGNAGINGQ